MGETWSRWLPLGEPFDFAQGGELCRTTRGLVPVETAACGWPFDPDTGWSGRWPAAGEGVTSEDASATRRRLQEVDEASCLVSLRELVTAAIVGYDVLLRSCVPRKGARGSSGIDAPRAARPQEEINGVTLNWIRMPRDFKTPAAPGLTVCPQA